MSSMNPTQHQLAPHTTILNVQDLPEIILVDYTDPEENNYTHTPGYLAVPYHDEQPSIGMSHAMTGFNWANQNQTYSTSPLSSLGHVVESAWKLRDGELVFDRAARAQEVWSTADSDDLEALEFREEQLPPDTTPPPAPHRHPKSLTPSLGPSHAPSLQSSPKHKGLDLQYSSGPNSPVVSQGWSPWPPSRRRKTDANMSGASSLLRAPDGTREPLDQETVTARLNDMLEQPRRRTFSPFRRLQQGYAAVTGRSSLRNSTTGSKRVVSFVSPTSTPVVPNPRPFRSPPPPDPVSSSPSLSLLDRSVAESPTSKNPIWLKRTDARKSPRAFAGPERIHSYRVSSPANVAASRAPLNSRPASPTPSSSDSSQHHSHPQYETPTRHSRVKFQDQPFAHSPSPPSRPNSAVLLPPGISRSRHQQPEHYQREADSFYGQSDNPPITLDPLSPLFTDSHHPNPGRSGTPNASQKPTFPQRSAGKSRNRQRDQVFKSAPLGTPDLLDTSTPWATLPVPAHEESPTSRPQNGSSPRPLGTSRTGNTWPYTFWPGHDDHPRSSGSERQSAAFLQRPLLRSDKLQDYSQHHHHHRSPAYDPGKAASGSFDIPAMTRSPKGKQREEFDTPLGAPQFESTPPRAIHRDEPTSKPPPSSTRPLTPPLDVVELLETNIRHLGFALGDIDGLSSYFGKTDLNYDVNPHTTISKRIRTALQGLDTALRRHRALTREQLQLASKRWHKKRDDRLRSLWRTIHGFGRFVHTISRREPTLSILTKSLAKLSQFESKLSNLASKFDSLLNRVRVRQLYSMLSRAHKEANKQLKGARSMRDIPGWDAGKKYRAELRREYVAFRNRFTQARRTSLRS